MSSVVVIGGGVIGTACAHYLQTTGWQVTILERERFGSGCSHANCGLVCPSHILPLAMSGVVMKTLGSLLKRNSPFYIKPRLDPSLWKWLLKFCLRCNGRDMLESARACHELLQSSAALYQKLMDSELLDCEWETKGVLLVYQNKSQFESYAEVDRIQRDHFNAPAQRVEADALSAMEPSLKDGLAGAWFYSSDAHLRPDKLLQSWRRVLESRGVKIVENADVKSFVKQNGNAVAVKMDGSELSADAFVVATGAWAPMLNSELGCKLPIQPGKGYSITMPRPRTCPVIPMLFPEHKVGVTPMKSGYRLGSTMEFSGYDKSINENRLGLLRKGAQCYLREPYCEPVQETWCGWRPMTYDGVPIIDRSPIMKNVMIAAGHNMIGLATATATGKLVSELLNNSTPHIDAAMYSLRRLAN